MLVWRLQLGRRLRIWKRFWLHQRVLSFCIVRRICRSCFRRKSRVMRVGTYNVWDSSTISFLSGCFYFEGFSVLASRFIFFGEFSGFEGYRAISFLAYFSFLFHWSEVFKRSALIVRRFLDIKIENRLDISWDNAFLVTSLHTNHVCHDFANLYAFCRGWCSSRLLVGSWNFQLAFPSSCKRMYDFV